MTGSRDGGPAPFISVVVPTYDRPAAVASCLRALQGQSYPADRFEIIVVNDGGRPVAATWKNQATNPRVRVLTQPNQGPGPARNTGAAEARGEFLAFTDDDCIPDPDWLTCLAIHCEASPDAIVGGRIENLLPRNPFSTASQLLVTHLYDYFERHPSHHRFFCSNNIALRGALFHEVGGFESTWLRATAEDRELCDRWQHQGYPLRYAPDAIVRHAHPLTARTFWRQHFNYGRGACYYHRARAGRGVPMFDLEPPTFYRDLMASPFGRPGLEGAWRSAFLLGITQLANAAGFAREWARRPGR